MTHKTFLFAALVGVLGWCCVSCESNEPSKSNTYVAKPFSVSTNQQVKFSSGNLQYTQSTDTWSFAAQQYEMIGEANVNGSELADKIDLFGWSGSIGAAKWGVSSSQENEDYVGHFVDWGQNIDEGSIWWRTLTNDEWTFLRETRVNASSLIGIARIKLCEDDTDYANGLILLPDNWVCPEGLTFKSGFANDWSIEAYANYQTFTLEQWSKLEAAGAVFLPAAGSRGPGVGGVQDSGYYWSSTLRDSRRAVSLIFLSDRALWDNDERHFGRSVRLVQDL